MIYEPVFFQYKKAQPHSVAANKCNNSNQIHQAVSELYQIDLFQPLQQVQQQILKVISEQINIDAILWHSDMAQNKVNADSLFPQYGLSSKEVTPFDVKLDDSNIHHYFFTTFSIELSESIKKANSLYFTTLLQLIAEIYRQTLIHSYFQEWKELPFQQLYHAIEDVDLALENLPTTNESNEFLYEKWHEIEEDNQDILIRVKRLDNQLFIDKFVISQQMQKLTFKQKQICFFLKACCSNQQIAENLNISVKTVGNHLTAIYDKLNVSRSELFQLLNSSD